MENSVVNKPRLTWIDNCRAMTICFVIYFHNSHIFDFSRDPLMPMLQAFTASFIMPMFVIISGYCGRSSIMKISSIKSLINHVIKNFSRLYVPGFSVALVMSVLGFEHFSSFISIMGGFWFLTMLFIVMSLTSILMYFVSVVISHSSTLSLYLNDKKKNVIVFFLIFILTIWIKPLHIGEMMPFFLTGFLLKEYNIIESKFYLKKFYFGLPILSIFLFCLFYYSDLLESRMGTFYSQTFPLFLLKGQVQFWFLRYVLSTTICLGFISFFYNISRTYTKFSALGSMTLSLYMFSTIPLFFLQKDNVYTIIKQTELFNFANSNSITLYFSNSVLTLLIIGFGILLTKLCSQWRFTRTIVLGERR